MTAEERWERADLVRELKVMETIAERAVDDLAQLQAEVREAINALDDGYPQSAVRALRRAIGQ